MKKKPNPKKKPTSVSVEPVTSARYIVVWGDDEGGSTYMYDKPTDAWRAALLAAQNGSPASVFEEISRLLRED